MTTLALNLSEQEAPVEIAKEQEPTIEDQLTLVSESKTKTLCS